MKILLAVIAIICFGAAALGLLLQSQWETKILKRNAELQVILTETGKPVIEWQSRHNVPGNRIIAAEFGCNRVAKGCQQYLSDLIDAFNDQGWYWSFYSFREDTWPGMDYEMGSKRLSEAQWMLLDDGGNLEYPLAPSSMSLMLRKKIRQIK